MRHSSSRSKHVAFLEPNSSHEESKNGDHYPVYLGQKYSYIARDDQDDDSSVFRDVVTPSPEGNGKIDEILGPPPAPTFLVPNASDVNDEASASKNSKSKSSSGSGGSRKQNGESTRMPREEPLVKMTATKYHAANDMEDTSEGKDDTPEVLTVTVHKVSQGEKIGIFVGLKKFSYGKRLVVSRVAPDGKFANSGVEAGDIVVSINGKNMLEKPSSQEAFGTYLLWWLEGRVKSILLLMYPFKLLNFSPDIVLAATDRVTFVVQKQGINDDSRSISGSTISSISRDFGYASTPERSGAKAGTQTSCTDEILEKKMAPDGSMILSKETDISEPVVIKANESWKLSGALAVAVKLTSANQNPGIQIGTRETSIGRVLYVSEISQTSPFAQTPLRVGDILLSINDIDLEENADVVGAYSALGNSKDEISIVARKAAESLNEFLYERKERTKAFCERKAVRSTQANLVNNSPDKSQRSSSTSGSRRTKPVERTESDQQKNKETSIVKPQTKSDPGNDSFEFDEESYGASLNGYNSSKQIKIVKSHPHESVGLDLEPIETDWGKLLTVANILPNSKAAKTPIKVGDAILAINGVDLRDSPDVEAAFSVIKRARSEVIVDIQQLSLYPIEVSSADSKPQDNITILAHDTVGVVRTRTFDSNDDFIAQTGTLKIAGRLDNTSVSGDWTENAPEIDANREALVIPASSLADGGSPTPNPPKKHRKVWVTIRKEYPSEKVGITFAALEKRLIVTNVSPSGLLRGTPVLPGDTILSINGADFSVDPDARYAFELVCMAPEEVLLEVLKTGYAIDAKNHDSKSCLRRPFGCGQKKTQEYAVRLERYPKDDDGETLSTSLADPVQF
jgi:C-terminal processing protease CtpA/Prc